MGFIKVSEARERIINYSRQHYYWLVENGKVEGIREPDKKTSPLMIDEDSLLSYLESIRVSLPE